MQNHTPTINFFVCDKIYQKKCEIFVPVTKVAFNTANISGVI